MCTFSYTKNGVNCVFDYVVLGAGCDDIKSAI